MAAVAAITPTAIDHESETRVGVALASSNYEPAHGVDRANALGMVLQRNRGHRSIDPLARLLPPSQRPRTPGFTSSRAKTVASSGVHKRGYLRSPGQCARFESFDGKSEKWLRANGLPDFSLEQLLVLAAGETTLGTIGARLNAAKKSPARAAASRTNGTKAVARERPPPNGT